MFAERVGAFLGDFFRLYPVAATAAGNHAHDGEWPNLTDAGQADRLAFIDDWTAELEAMPAASLTPDDRIDRDLLISELAALRFDAAKGATIDSPLTERGIGYRFVEK